VALRQILDLYSCERPVRYFEGVPSPVKHPEKLDVFIFRENTEDVYIGIEWKSGTPEAKKLLEFLNNDMLKDGKKQIRWDLGRRHQADFADGHEAAGAARDQVRFEAQAEERNARAQREYSEIYGRRIPRLGLRPGTRRVSERRRLRNARVGFWITWTRTRG